MNQAPWPSRAQRGSTLVGFIVGLLVGLGLALSVALYVTRMPVPFVDRSVSRSPEKDAQEAERNKGWNPNAQLAGKPAPLPTPQAGDEAAGVTVVPPTTDGRPSTASTNKPAAAAPATDVSAKPAAAPATEVTAKPAAAPTVVGTAKPAAAAPATTDSKSATAESKPAAAAGKPAADPLGDLVNAKLGQAAASAPAPKSAPAGAATAATAADPFTYFVQAGAFKTPTDADAQRAKLAMMGMAAAVSEREQAGQTVFRVRLGPFNDKAKADAAREQLEGHGVEAVLVRVQR
jgi:cell division protein FtsN